nr:MAG TPA: hypothetical protein [Caudoviricetes sp.]
MHASLLRMYSIPLSCAILHPFPFLSEKYSQ